MLGQRFVSANRCRAVKCCRSLVCLAAFNFAEPTRGKPAHQGRRNRAVEKRQEQQLRTIVHGLCAFSPKQLQAVSHLLSEEHLKQIKIAMNIPPTNQGRRRQEALVVKLLRADQASLAVDKLMDAVHQARDNKVSFRDNDVEQQLDVWTEGLIDNDQEVVDEVYQLLQDNKLDWQQMRVWMRQAQQHRQQERQQAQPQQQQAVLQQQEHQQLALIQQAPGMDDGSRPPTDTNAQQNNQIAVVHDPEVLQLIQQLAQKRQQPQTQLKKTNSSNGKTALRSMRRMLKPLAVMYVQ